MEGIKIVTTGGSGRTDMKPTIEAIDKLNSSIESLNETTKKSNKRMFWLTVVIATLTFVLVVLTIKLVFFP